MWCSNLPVVHHCMLDSRWISPCQCLPVPEQTMSLLGDSDMASASLSRSPSSVLSMDDMWRSPKLSGQLPHTSSKVTLRSKVPAWDRGRGTVRMLKGWTLSGAGNSGLGSNYIISAELQKDKPWKNYKYPPCNVTGNVRFNLQTTDVRTM